MAEDKEDEIAIPGWVRFSLALLSGLFFLVLLFLYFCYLSNPEKLAPPSELGLPTLMIFCGTIFLLTAIPWWKWGLSIRKIGPLEFTNALGRQQKDTNESIVYLQQQIDELQHHVSHDSEMHQMGKMVHGPEVEAALREYFSKNPGAISPRKLRSLIGKVDALQNLRGKDNLLIQSILRELAARGFLATTVSRKGNTLYKLSLGDKDQ